jgi:hypothetical protein
MTQVDGPDFHYYHITVGTKLWSLVGNSFPSIQGIIIDIDKRQSQSYSQSKTIPCRLIY